MAKLAPKRARFVEEYLKDLNGKQAVIRAGFKGTEHSAEVEASRLLRNAEVKAAVDAGIAARSARVQVTQDEVLLEFKRLAFADIGKAFDDKGRLLPLKDMPEEVRRAISAVEVEALYEGSGADRVRSGDLVKVKFWDKKGSIDSLAKHLGMFVEKHEVNVGGSLEELVLAVRKVKK